MERNGLWRSLTITTMAFIGFTASPVESAPLPGDTWSGEPIEVPTLLRKPQSLRAVLTAVEGFGGIAGSCPTEVVTYTDFDFQGGAFALQAGFEQGETAACAYTVPAEHFPLKIDLTEMIFGTDNATVQTVTEWTWLVWEGTPNNGNLIAQFSSGADELPDIILPPGDNGINVQVLVDPDDPEQVIVTNNGSNTFSIGYRIDAHQSPGTPCLFPPSATQNAFPATDVSGLASPAGNWICAVDGQFCVCSPGFCSSFQSLPQLCTPSGDWLMRVTYTPFACEGAEGACCTVDGDCLDGLLEPECDVLNGTFQGEGSTCNGVNCPAPEGACCFPPDACIELSEADCNSVGGFYEGNGTDCNSIVCFETGACCFPDGSCTDDQDPEDCTNAGGTYQGSESTCAGTSCPQPEGACCFLNGACLVLTEADCLAVPTNSWQGAFTTCDPSPCDPQGACCFPNGSCLLLSEAECDAIPNTDFQGVGTECSPDPCCPEDCAGDDGQVDTVDLLTLLAQWGGPGTCDIDGSGMIDTVDLLALLSAWGSCQG